MSRFKAIPSNPYAKCRDCKKFPVKDSYSFFDLSREVLTLKGTTANPVICYECKQAADNGSVSSTANTQTLPQIAPQKPKAQYVVNGSVKSVCPICDEIVQPFQPMVEVNGIITCHPCHSGKPGKPRKSKENIPIESKIDFKMPEITSQVQDIPKEGLDALNRRIDAFQKALLELQNKVLGLEDKMEIK